jgi:hypothetical protein
MALRCGKFQFGDSSVPIGLGSGHLQQPTHGRRFLAQKIIFNATGDIGVVTSWIKPQKSFGIVPRLLDFP